MLFAVFFALLFGYSLVSNRLGQTIVTAPMVFTVVGMALCMTVTNAVPQPIDATLFRHLAETGLVLLLFTDASKTDLTFLKSIQHLPARLLSVGMLLCIALGAVTAHFVFPQLSIWEAGILSAILAPTDAGLGQIIVNSPRVPMRIRQALNVEAGMNDGLAVPFLMFFMAMAAGAGTGNSHSASLVSYMFNQLGLGAVVGVAIGFIGGELLSLSERRGWMSKSFRHIGFLMLPFMCIVASNATGASMFIAAFVGGLALQVGFKVSDEHAAELTEEWGQVLNLSVFFLFGVVIVRAWPSFRFSHWLYGALSLTLVRMVPIAVSLLGTQLSKGTLIFMGWFGPRGLASIVLGLVFLEQEIHLQGELTIRLTVIATVCMSIFAHGISALPGIALYARTLSALDANEPEHPNVQSSY